MEKTIRYCSTCEKSFVTEISFCPGCSARLSTYQIDLTTDDPKTEKPATEKKEIYSITLVENETSQVRRFLMIGAFFFVMGGALCGLVISIYNSDAFVAGLDDNLVGIVRVPSDESIELEPEPLPEEEKKNGGGGSGGNKNPNPLSKGVYANQSNDPKIAPSVSSHRLKNPDIPIEMQTKGVTKRKPTNDPYGDPTSKFDIPSDGSGDLGGQGAGFERGQGPGKGPGGGISVGPGSQTGTPGTESIDGSKPKLKEDEPPKPPKAVVTALKILDKPRAIYTDAARRNLVAGTVTLRVTFTADGTIGNIAVVGGLPDGLTEQAILAARNIRFEPAKRNGVAQTVTKQVQYTFTLY